MKEKKIDLQILYYYLFLSTFGIIIFSNLIPEEFIWVTRLFVFPTAILSLLLLDNRIGFLYVVFFTLFILSYSLYSLVFHDVYLEYLVKNTRYVFYFIFMFGLVNILKFISLEKLLYGMSKIFILKILIVAIINFNLNSEIMFASNFLLNNTGLLIAKLSDSYRILDIYLYFFPLIFIYLRDKKNFIKIFLHLIVIYNLYVSNTYGFIIAYFVIMFLKYNFFRLLSIGLITILLFYGLSDIIRELIAAKSFSIEVKLNQLLYVINNLSFFGEGLGTNIVIEDRIDSMLENTVLYWLVVYGIFGFIIIGAYFIFLPFFVFYLFKYNNVLKDLFYMNLSVLIATTSNPYIESNVGIMPMLIIISYFLNKNDYFSKKFSSRRYNENS